MPLLRWSSVAFGLVLSTLSPAADYAHAQSAHVVQPGETLSQIALDAGVDPSAIAALNGLDDPNALSVGQSLKLSAGAYTIVDGDTLWAIAQRFGTTTDALIQANQLDDPNHLVVGASLTVPSTRPLQTAVATPVSTPSAVPALAAAPVQSQGRTVLASYTVQPGDTLSGIARQFNVRADAIAQASSLDDPNKLGAGAVLKVPVAAKQHVVSDGETLRDIAAAEKVDLGSLIDFNALDDPELIRVGQVLLLPVTAGNQQQAASVKPAATPAPMVSATPTRKASPASTSAPTPSPSPLATPTATPKVTQAPRAPVAVVAPPPGAPTDGLAGAGLKLLGSPYVWGGSSPSGFDCSGFVWYIARQIGKPISRGLFAQYNAGAHPARDQLQVGDLVFFQNTFTAGLSHNGIYIGNGQFVHAADEAAGVTISSLNTAYWSSHWFGATRI
jgi:cell wall-associated NlpC family hydrolase